MNEVLLVVSQLLYCNILIYMCECYMCATIYNHQTVAASSLSSEVSTKKITEW